MKSQKLSWAVCACTWHALYGSVANSNARIEENVGGSRVVQAFEEFAHPHPSDATSVLGTQTERAIQQSLAELCKDRRTRWRW